MAERKALIRHSEKHPELSHVQLAEWVAKEMKEKVHPTTIVGILAKREAILLMKNDQQVRGRPGKWPEIEKLLVVWVDEYNACNGNVTKALLQEKALNVMEELRTRRVRSNPWTRGSSIASRLGFGGGC